MTVLPSAETSRDSQATSSSCRSLQRRQRDLRRADLDAGAIDRVELPRRQDRHDARRQLDVHELTRRTPLALNATRAPPVQRMPAIVDDDILPDMGRMTARLPRRKNWTFAGSDCRRRARRRSRTR